jgi:Fe-Mn family superoxide dismutase
MSFHLPTLPFEPTHVFGCLSGETLDFHYGRHHRTYVERLNALLPGTGLETASLEEIVLRADGALFSNAAQAWNHTFYWYGLSKVQKGVQARPPLERLPLLAKAIQESFGTFEEFQRKFSAAALSLFGSGWTWLVLNERTGKLEILQTFNADNPIRQGLRPLLTCDVWEHAYYIDFRNARGKYVDAFLKFVDWTFVDHNLSETRVFDVTARMRASLDESGRPPEEKAQPGPVTLHGRG